MDTPSEAAIEVCLVFTNWGDFNTSLIPQATKTKAIRGLLISSAISIHASKANEL